MNEGRLLRLLMGLVVGAAYGLVQVRAPAPPLIALVGLLGILAGEQGAVLVKRHLAPPPREPRSVRSPAMSGSLPESVNAPAEPPKAGYNFPGQVPRAPASISISPPAWRRPKARLRGGPCATQAG